MVYFCISLVFLMLGLYAGKRRAKGEGWCQILCDLCYDLKEYILAVWTHVANLFRSEPDAAAKDENAE